MGYIMVTPPPGMTKEERERFYKATDRYFTVMMWLMGIAGFLFFVMIMLILYLKFIK